ncbi:serine/threonine-protein kinase [Allorhodopirellula solitaria]|uniref:Serine/threonine-protein kinase PknB n=1 Tax=Allorhodopirellula solitaria TaxID=2527987 RepID=A0A5C5XWF8_9BACT|nr:serine/threonine-protein kinase [Allorhodopirellula solitaria]TWT66683.1 Serine/threonine-protein kinase PknB [Allorhodopirellula solitaria]
MNIRQEPLPIAILERIDDQCAAFEKAWQTGERPSIQDSLPEDLTGRPQEFLLAELIALDIDYRKRRGESPTGQYYAESFPQHETLIANVFAEADRSQRPFEPASIERVAELFPELRIMELLGAGGMGAVYKAKQEGLDRVVALKVLPSEFAHDAKFSLRFTREARTLAKLNHPNIVSVFEFGHVDETYFFLMEYVDGPTLRDVVTAGELSPPQALAIVPQLCDALQYAHENGVIHRDIKPENILLTRDGTVKIVDFGLSRILGGSNAATNLTATHQVMGTPRYMAPEQFEGAHSVDHRADIYSLGVVFYELLTGELPIGRFEVPSKKVAIDVRLDEVVLRTLEKEPNRRYQAASEIKSDLQSIHQGDDIDLAVTVDQSSAASTRDSQPSGMEDQELAARMLLGRRDLMNQVRQTMRPLVRWQIVQIVIGVALIVLGVYGWSGSGESIARFASGLIMHVYGILLVIAAIAVIVRIKQIDYSQPVSAIGHRLRSARSLYFRFGPPIGLAWWWLWIPAGLAAGFLQLLHPHAMVPSLIVGVIGFFGSLWLFRRGRRLGNIDGMSWEDRVGGSSFRESLKLLGEIERAEIQ